MDDVLKLSSRYVKIEPPSTGTITMRPDLDPRHTTPNMGTSFLRVRLSPLGI
jgi:hypothetical protein